MTSDRSTDRVGYRAGERPGGGAKAARLAGGRLASDTRRRPPAYLTAARLALLHDNLTPSDWAVLDTVREFGLVSGPQLAQLHFGSAESDARAARRSLRRLREAQVLDVLERRIGGVRAGSSGLVYRLGLAGLRLLGIGRQALGEPGLHHLCHTLAIVDVLVELTAAARRGELTIGRFDREPACWRQYTGPHGEPVVLKPDAYAELVINGRRRLWFVEVDRGTVSTATLQRKLARYAEYLATGIEQASHRGAFPRVVWTAGTARRADYLRALCAAANHRLGAELHRLLPEEWQPP